MENCKDLECCTKLLSIQGKEETEVEGKVGRKAVCEQIFFSQKPGKITQFQKILKKLKLKTLLV